MTETRQQAPMAVDQAHDFAGDLLRRLVPFIGDADAIETELQRWLDLLGCPTLAQVLLAAVQRTFTECLTYPETWPADGIAFHAEKETSR